MTGERAERRRVAVAGGTGVAGRHVVAALERAGHDAVVLSRARGVDVTTGAGVDAALEGVHAVVDVTNVDTLRERVSVAFFARATATLLAAGARAGAAHHVALSIVGADRVPFGYYAGKRHQEALVAAGAVPWTVLRATQFHEFAGQTLDRTPGPVALVPRMRIRPVAVREVAEELARRAVGPAAGTVELAGPREEDLAAMARRVVAARGRRRRVVDVRLPGATGRGFADGGLLPTGAVATGTTTFDAWLTGPDGPGAGAAEPARG